MSIKIKEWMAKNNVNEALIKKGRAVVAISCNKEDNPDTAVTDQSTGNPIYMRKIENFNTEIDEDVVRVFIVGIDQWKRITTKNLFISKIKQEPR